MAHPDWQDNEFVDYQQSKSFTLLTQEPFQMNLDGEPLRATRFEFEICEKALPLILPANCPLLSQTQTAMEKQTAP